MQALPALTLPSSLWPPIYIAILQSTEERAYLIASRERMSVIKGSGKEQVIVTEAITWVSEQRLLFEQRFLVLLEGVTVLLLSFEEG